jgi:hypothetical protein
MSIEDLVRDEINAEMLEELREEILPPIEPGEYTAAEYAEVLGCNENKMKKILDLKVKAGRMTSRMVIASSRKATAYRVVIGVG